MRRGSLIFAVWLAASVAAGQDYKAGDRVVVIKRAKLTVQNAAGPEVVAGLTLPVEEAKAGRLLLSNGTPGWLDKSNVVAFDRAADHFAAALKADPKNIELRFALALLKREKSDFNGCIADLDELIRLKPGDAKYFNARGTTWRAKCATTRPSPTATKRFGSIQNSRRRTRTAAKLGPQSASRTKRLPISTKRSALIRN